MAGLLIPHFGLGSGERGTRAPTSQNATFMESYAPSSTRTLSNAKWIPSPLFQLVHVSGNEYCTREHDSLKISNGKWNWWSRGFGGASALDYLVKVKEIPFLQAMGMILDTEGKSPSFFDAQRPEKRVEKRLLLPEKSRSNDQIIRYLTGRGIDREVIESCIREGLLYESLPYHNCIFVGYDHDQVPRYACFRATGPEKIMGDAAGSDKRYAFRIERGGSTIHVFESAIDLLSFATIMKQRTREWRAEPMVSLGGVYASRRGTQLMKLPAALTKALDRHEEVGTIALHLDADFAGRNAAASIADQLKPYYRIRNEPPPIGKDCNDYLQYLRQREARIRGGRVSVISDTMPSLISKP